MTAPSVLHLVLTENFAGVERYVSGVCAEVAGRGWRVVVAGGDPVRMPAEVGPNVAWLPAGTPLEALRSIRKARRLAGPFDICHVHMTMAEAAGALTQGLHGGRLIATRHFAAQRGSSLTGRMASPWLRRRLSTQIAISRFVDSRLEQPADVVLLNGTPSSERLWSPDNRIVLVLQRLEAEKDTATALRAWQESKLADRGWTLRIAGAGSQEEHLKLMAAEMELSAVDFAGHVVDVQAEFRRAGMLLATAPAEPFGLSVTEAMAAGIPVVAADGGGHQETIGAVTGAPRFAPGDHVQAGQYLAELAEPANPRLSELSSDVWAFHRRVLSLEAHCDQLATVYANVVPQLSSQREIA